MRLSDKAMWLIVGVEILPGSAVLQSRLTRRLIDVLKREERTE